MVRSMLDTDLYKFTTSYAYMKMFPDAECTFTFVDRNRIPRSDDFLEKFKKKLKEGLKAKLGALLAYSKIRELKQLFDYADVGGAPILGLKGAVLKIHGNSREAEVYYAVIKAIPYIRNNVTQMIADAVTQNEALFKTAEASEEAAN